MLDNQRKEADKAEAGADRGQIQAPAISLPKGGGAIKDIDEKFTVNPATGTASLSVPIFASPSRSDFYPKLSLNYDSGAGNGPFGLGWNIDIPSITRKTDKGIPKYQDAEESDTFILSGAEDLVPVIGDDLANYEVDGYSVKRYRPRIEGLFARIEKWQHKGTGKVHWRSISKENVISIYGKSDDAKIVDPDDEFKVFKWLIEESYDDKGNIIVYEYKEENQGNTKEAIPILNKQRKYTNKHIKTIRYGNKKPRKKDTWLFEIVFDYGEHQYREVEIIINGVNEKRIECSFDEKMDWECQAGAFSSYRAGFEIRTSCLCQRVLMYHRFDELDKNPCLARSTKFNYQKNQCVSYLKSISQVGYIYDKANDNYSFKSLPPLDFSYIPPKINDTIDSIDSKSLKNLPIGIDATQYQFVDLDGEGISGILSGTEDAWYYKRNLGNARFGPLETVASKPSLANLRTGQGQILDLGGDGQKDLVLLEEPVPGFYERTDEYEWEPFKPFKSLPNINWKDPNLRMIDLNGDGHTDILITEDEEFTWYSSKAEEGFDQANYVRKAFDEENGPALVFADATQSIYLADMTGDGLIDIMRIKNGSVCYWPNMGYGHFGAKVTMANAPDFDFFDQFDQKRIRLADVDGTGPTDIIYLGYDEAKIWFNQAGNCWTKEPETISLPPTDNLSSVNVFDLLGNGTSCLVWSSPLLNDTQQPMKYISLMGLSYMLTEKSLENLKSEGVPDDILAKFESIKNHKFANKEKFLDIIKSTIGDEATVWNRSLILKHAVKDGIKPHLLESIKNKMGKETVLEYASSTKFYLEDKAVGNPWITRLPFPVHVIEKVETHEWVTGIKLVNRYKYHHGYFDGKDREFRGFGMVEQFDSETFSQFKQNGLISGEISNADEELHSIPVKIKTWFHTGNYLNGKKISKQCEDEYYEFDDDKWLLDDAVIEEDLTIEEMHEACRALKGVMLRQEIYATKGENKEHPYRTTEQNYQLKRLQPLGDNRHAVFYAHPRETLEYHYEQIEDDPRITHQMILGIDEFGNERKTATIAYPRRNPEQPGQEKPLITCSEAGFINKYDEDPTDIDNYFYRVGVPCETRIYEIKKSLPADKCFGFKDIKDFVERAQMTPFDEDLNPDENKKRLIECTRTLYKKNDQSNKLDLGEIESLALPYETYEMAVTPGLRSKVYSAEVDGNMLVITGRYKKGDEIHTAGDFRDASWWIPSGTQYFKPDNFYLPTEITDPFGETYYTEYDDYSLLIVETKDPQENTVTAENNYRTLLPWLITDPNENKSGVRFNELGMVVESAVMGKNLSGEWEGDKLDISTAESSTADDPTTKLAYYLDEYKENQKPIYVYTETREKHK